MGGGFQGEFSGAENAVQAWVLRGWLRKEAEAGLAELRDFSGLSRSLELPIRTYSAGMLARLAFGIATQERPDLILLDEVLAVGDMEFRERCLARLQGYRSQGTALVFATHDAGILTSMADEAWLLSQGRVAVQGDPTMVLSAAAQEPRP